MNNAIKHLKYTLGFYQREKANFQHFLNKHKESDAQEFSLLFSLDAFLHQYREKLANNIFFNGFELFCVEIKRDKIKEISVYESDLFLQLKRKHLDENKEVTNVFSESYQEIETPVLESDLINKNKPFEEAKGESNFEKRETRNLKKKDKNPNNGSSEETNRDEYIEDKTLNQVISSNVSKNSRSNKVMIFAIVFGFILIASIIVSSIYYLLAFRVILTKTSAK